VPYHTAVADSGRRIGRHGILDLQRFDDKVVQAKVESKRLGQDWHYNATLKADIQPGGMADLEPEPTEVEAAPAPGSPAGGNSRALKMALGKFGYEATSEGLIQAVGDANLEAVQLFMKLGQSPNVKSGDNHLMLLSTMWCSRPPTENRTAIIQTLLANKGDVKAKDMNGSTALLWAVDSCEPAAIDALIKAGSDVNVKAKGGGTPLMMAKVLNKPEIVALLLKAGAKE
jgi:hypothetical protein